MLKAAFLKGIPRSRSSLSSLSFEIRASSTEFQDLKCRFLKIKLSPLEILASDNIVQCYGIL
jgi:hypothetical protein